MGGAAPARHMECRLVELSCCSEVSLLKASPLLPAVPRFRNRVIACSIAGALDVFASFGSPGLT
eukprot:2566501-Alexandrium_andersonii.AAC.1